MVDHSTSRRRRTTSSIARAYRESHEVMSAALSVALLTGGGYWLDVKFGWKPVLTICGVVVGCLTGVASLHRLLVRLDKQSQNQRDSSASKKASEK